MTIQLPSIKANNAPYPSESFPPREMRDIGARKADIFPTTKKRGIKNQLRKRVCELFCLLLLFRYNKILHNIQAIKRPEYRKTSICIKPDLAPENDPNIFIIRNQKEYVVNTV